MNRELICSFLNENGIAYKPNENMARYTTFKIGGNADFLVEVNNETELTKIYEFCAENDINLTVLGKGSNVLVSDDGIDGIVVLLSGLDDISVKDNTIICGAGAPLTALCNSAAANSLSGLEFAFGIPGTVGGAVIMNAGAYGGEIKDVISRVRYLDTDGQIKRYQKNKWNSATAQVFLKQTAVLYYLPNLFFQKAVTPILRLKWPTLCHVENPSNHLNIQVQAVLLNALRAILRVHLLKKTHLKGIRLVALWLAKNTQALL